MTQENNRQLERDLWESAVELRANSKLIEAIYKDRKTVKKVAKETLNKLKEEKLKIDRWREKREITAQVRTLIHDKLLWLPQEVNSYDDVEVKTIDVYQHIHTNY